MVYVDYYKYFSSFWFKSQISVLVESCLEIKSVFCNQNHFSENNFNMHKWYKCKKKTVQAKQSMTKIFKLKQTYIL